MAGSPEIQAAPLWTPNEAATPTKGVEEPPSLTPLRRERLARVGDSAVRTGLHEPAEPGFTTWQDPAAAGPPEVTHAARRNPNSVVGAAPILLSPPACPLFPIYTLCCALGWAGSGLTRKVGVRMGAGVGPKVYRLGPDGRGTWLSCCKYGCCLLLRAKHGAESEGLRFAIHNSGLPGPYLYTARGTYFFTASRISTQTNLWPFKGRT